MPALASLDLGCRHTAPADTPQSTTPLSARVNASAPPQDASVWNGLQLPDVGIAFPSFDAGAASSQNETSIDPNRATVATVPLGLLAQTEAAGMHKDGPLVVGSFQQGQTLNSQFQVVAGKCHAIVADGIGPQDLDLSGSLVTPLPGLQS